MGCSPSLLNRTMTGLRFARDCALGNRSRRTAKPSTGAVVGAAGRVAGSADFAGVAGLAGLAGLAGAAGAGAANSRTATIDSRARLIQHLDVDGMPFLTPTLSQSFIGVRVSAMSARPPLRRASR